jgi:hypothetical protein
MGGAYAHMAYMGAPNPGGGSGQPWGIPMAAAGAPMQQQHWPGGYFGYYGYPMGSMPAAGAAPMPHQASVAAGYNPVTAVSDAVPKAHVAGLAVAAAPAIAADVTPPEAAFAVRGGLEGPAMAASPSSPSSHAGVQSAPAPSLTAAAPAQATVVHESNGNGYGHTEARSLDGAATATLPAGGVTHDAVGALMPPSDIQMSSSGGPGQAAALETPAPGAVGNVGNLSHTSDTQQQPLLEVPGVGPYGVHEQQPVLAYQQYQQYPGAGYAFAAYPQSPLQQQPGGMLMAAAPLGARHAQWGYQGNGYGYGYSQTQVNHCPAVLARCRRLNGHI